MSADTQPVDDRPSLLDVLRADAAKLTESELPTTEELRPLVGALVQSLERIAGEQVDAFAAGPEDEQVAEPGYVEVNLGAGEPPAPIVVEAPESPESPAPPAPASPEGQS